MFQAELRFRINDRQSSRAITSLRLQETNKTFAVVVCMTTPTVSHVHLEYGTTQVIPVVQVDYQDYF